MKYLLRSAWVKLILGWMSTMALCPALATAMEVSFEHDPSLPLVYINLAVKTGSVSDPGGQAGITNFMGEMLLRGTMARTKEQIDLELDQLGARIEVETRAEALVVRGAVLASQLDRFLSLVADIVTHPSFPEHEIRKLKSETISAILEELGRDQSLAARRFTKFLFNDHPYGNPVLGTVRDIEKLTRTQVLNHYGTLFRDKRLLLVGSGSATDGQIRHWATQIAKARTGGEPPALVQTPEDATTRRLQIIDKPDRTQTQIYAGQIGIRMTDERFFPLYLANHAFGGGSFSARLMVEVRVKRGWSYGANSYFRHGLRPRSWQFYLFPAAKDASDALSLCLSMIEELSKKGITQEEFDFAKQSLVNSAGFMYNTPQKRVENKLLEKTLDLPDDFMKTYGPELQKVTLQQVNLAAKNYFKADRLSINVLGTAQELKERLAKAAGVPVDKVEVVPYTQE